MSTHLRRNIQQHIHRPAARLRQAFRGDDDCFNVARNIRLRGFVLLDRGVGHMRQMAVDALQIAENIQMNRTGLVRFLAASVQPRKVPVAQVSDFVIQRQLVVQ